jgi:hypothetical protein
VCVHTMKLGRWGPPWWGLGPRCTLQSDRVSAKKVLDRPPERPHGLEIKIWPPDTVAQIAHSAPADSFSGPL